MAIMYRMTANMVFDTEVDAIRWRDALKAKALQARDSGTFPAWVGANIGIQPYSIGLTPTDESLLWEGEK